MLKLFLKNFLVSELELSASARHQLNGSRAQRRAGREAPEAGEKHSVKLPAPIPLLSDGSAPPRSALALSIC